MLTVLGSGILEKLVEVEMRPFIGSASLRLAV